MKFNAIFDSPATDAGEEINSILCELKPMTVNTLKKYLKRIDPDFESIDPDSQFFDGTFTDGVDFRGQFMFKGAGLFGQHKTGHGPGRLVEPNQKLSELTGKNGVPHGLSRAIFADSR